MIVSLWGFMGSGKSTIGQAFERAFSWQHIDSDDQIELKEKMSIKDIFERHGEEHFRELETRYLKQLLEEHQRGGERSFLLTTGGGMPVKEENRILLKNLGKTIMIHVPFEEIVERLRSDQDRPLWNAQELETMKNRYEHRLAYYQEADYILQAKQKSVEEIIDELADFLKLLR